MFEHALAMGDRSRRQFLRWRIERQSMLRPCLPTGARPLNARPKTLKTDRMPHTNVVSHFGLHGIPHNPNPRSVVRGSRSAAREPLEQYDLLERPQHTTGLDLRLTAPVLQDLELVRALHEAA
jgi:hypothetical protein